MPTDIGKGVVQVTFDSAQGVADAQKQVSSAVTRIATDAAAIFAAKKIFDFGKAGLDELKQAQAVTAQTDVLLRNLGSTAGVTSGEVDDLAKAQLRLSGVDDEVAKSAENVLLRMGLTGQTFKETTGLSNDLAVAMGTDMVSAAELLGKALAHPEQAARLLKPAIGGLTTEQLSAIKAFQATGDAAGAQGVILDAVSAKVKGAAAAYGQTLPGQIAIAQESIKNAQGALVAGFAPALEVTARVATSLADAVGKLPQPLQETVGVIGLVGGATVALARPVRDITELYGKWRAARTAATTAEIAGAAATKATTVAVVAEGAALGTTTVELEGNAAATNSAAAVSGLYAKSSLLTAASIGNVGLAAAKAAGPLAIFTAGYIALSQVPDRFAIGDRGAKAMFGPTGSLNGDLDSANPKVREAARNVQYLTGFVEKWSSVADNAKGHTKELSDAEQELADHNKDLAGTTALLIDKVAASTKAYEDHNAAINDVVSANVSYSEAQQRVLEDVQNATKAVDDHTTAQDETVIATDQAKDSIITLGNTAVSQYTALTGASKDSQGAIDQQRTALQNVANTLAPGSPLRVWLDQYIASLHSVPPHVGTILDIFTQIHGGGGSGIATGAKGPQSHGGIYHLTEPTTFTAGDMGGETAIFLPDNPGLRTGPGLDAMSWGSTGSASRGGGTAPLVGVVNIYADTYEGGRAAGDGFMDVVMRRQMEEMTRAAVG